MKFREMLRPLREGKKIRLPQWGGYWQKNDKGEIIMHCHNSEDINIRDSVDMFWTLENICSEEWEIITDDVDKTENSKEVSSNDLYHFLLDKYLEIGEVINSDDANNINSIVHQLMDRYNIIYK